MTNCFKYFNCLCFYGLITALEINAHDFEANICGTSFLFSDTVPPVHLNELMHHCHVSVQTLSLVLQKIVVGCADLTNKIVADSQLLIFIMDLNLQILHNGKELFLSWFVVPFFYNENNKC